MRHLMIADKSLLVGDDVADALARYAAHLGQQRSADQVTIRAIGVDGAEVAVQLVLNSGTVMAVESTASTLGAPDNADIVGYIEAQLAQFELRAD
jgi:hypothetical protein